MFSTTEDMFVFVSGVGTTLADLEEGASGSAPPAEDSAFESVPSAKEVEGQFLLACREWKSWTAIRKTSSVLKTVLK